MFKKHVLIILILALPFLIIINPQLHIAQTSTVANVYIDPPEVEKTMNETFTINVDVADVSNLGGWGLLLYYKSKVLNATVWEEGPFLKDVRGTFTLTGEWNDHYNQTHGRLWLVCVLLGTGPGANGSGTLASITFKAKGPGYSPLSLRPEPGEQTILFDSTPHNPQDIPHTTTGGSVTVIGHNIAVVDIQLSKTITNDTMVEINVTAANLGTYPASFNVTIYYDSTEIETQTVTDLLPTASQMLDFTWDTTPVPKGNYTISAVTDILPGETDPDDNTLIDGWIKETIRGDVNGDSKVDIRDITIVAMAFGTEPGDPNWTDNGDLDNNNIINIRDITTVAMEFGKSDP